MLGIQALGIQAGNPLLVYNIGGAGGPNQFSLIPIRIKSCMAIASMA